MSEQSGMGDRYPKFEGPTFSPTKAGDFDESPAHFYSFHVLKERETTADMALGTAIHMALLEPDRFDKAYCGPNVDVSGALKTADEMRKVLKEHGLKASGSKAELLERIKTEVNPFLEGDPYKSEEEILGDYAAGREMLSEKDWKACLRIKENVSKSRQNLQFFISGGTPEINLWHETEDGIQLRGRADYIKEFEKPVKGFDGVVVDAKKVRSAKPENFERTIFNSKMYIKAALYVDMLKAITGRNYMFLWIAVEDKAPWIVQGYSADFGMLEAGRAKWNKIYFDFLKAIKTQTFPGYSENILNASLPSWAWAKLEMEESY